MKTIAFIPVRGGSKSIPMKNCKDFCGKPLLYWTMRAAELSHSVDRIVIATDSEEIAKSALSFHFAKTIIYHRSAENAQDTSSTESVMLEYLDNVELDDDAQFVLIQATNPFLTSTDIDAGMDLMKKEGKDSLLSCARIKRFFWNEEGNPLNYDYMKRPRRQDFNGILIENGAFYISSVKNIKTHRNRLCGKVAVYEMPEYSSIEIDEPDDWSIAENAMRKYILPHVPKKKIKLFLTDVDGVLTDAGMYYSEHGDELKKFNTLDGKGLEMLRLAGIKTGIITGENTQLVIRRAQKLKMDTVHLGIKDKLPVAKKICEQFGIGLDEVAYIGDDINCYELLTQVGYAACPATAVSKVKSIPGIRITQAKGGEGAVREFVEELAQEQGLFDNLQF